MKHLNSSDVGVTGPWTGGSPAPSTTDIAGQPLQPCPNGATTTVAYTFNANASFGNGALLELDLVTGLNAAAGTVTIGDPDIRLTPGLTPGLQSVVQVPEMRTVSVEHLQCQRFLPALIPGNIGPVPGAGIATSTTTGDIDVPFLTKARLPPSAMVLDATAHWGVINVGGTTTNFSIASGAGATSLAAEIDFKARRRTKASPHPTLAGPRRSPHLLLAAGGQFCRKSLSSPSGV